jgi:very-short-patch-repair endonuclease
LNHGKENALLGRGPIFKKAQELRNRQTTGEIKLWMHLRTKPKGYEFRRQHPAFNYILDFYCHALRLAIEVDGSMHDEREIMQNDMERQRNLETQGVKFIRFTNEEIMLNLEEVIEKIDFVIDECQEKAISPDLNFFEGNDKE